MTDQTTPTGPHDGGGEPTVPLVPASGYRQPDVPELEHTSLDLFAPGDYPDFSYDRSSVDHPDSSTMRIDPNPLPAASNYAQPSVPASVFAETYRPAQTTYHQPAPQPEPLVLEAPAPNPGTQYQQYPVATVTPLQNPVAYDYGYARPMMVVPEHPNAVLSLVLGLVGLFVFPLLPSIAAWVVAGRARRSIADNPGRWANGGTLTAGFVLGIIGTLFWGLLTLFYVGIAAILVLAAMAS